MYKNSQIHSFHPKKAIAPSTLQAFQSITTTLIAHTVNSILPEIFPILSDLLDYGFLSEVPQRLALKHKRMSCVALSWSKNSLLRSFTTKLYFFLVLLTFV